MISSALLTLGVVGVFAGLLYVFLVWNFDYWKKRGAKGPKPTPFLGSFPGLVTQKNHMAYDVQKIYKQFQHDEDFVGVFSIRTPQLMITSPELARKVFVTDFRYFHDNESTTWVDEKNDRILANNPFMLRGEEWKERRQEIIPGLSSNRIKAVYPVTKKICSKLRQYIKSRSKSTDGNGIDGKDLSLRFTTEVVTDCVLGLNADSLTDNPTPIMETVKKLFEQTTFFTVYGFLAGLWPGIKRFYKARFFSKGTEEFFVDLMNSAFDMRRKQIIDRTDRGDFLNFILQLQDKKNLSNIQLTSHTMTFLLDGFETSASVLAITLYQLAKSPSVQEKLLKEVLANINDEGEIDYEKLHEMSYLDQCVHEAMRITPPLLFSMKLCTEPIELTNKNGSKVKLNVDDIVMIPVFAFHHDEQYFPEPNKFLPERFDPENGGIKKFRDMGVFYPFGDGPRICIGMKFALTQVKAAVAEIVKSFNMTLNPKTRTDNRLHPTYFLGGLDGGIWLEFEERK